MTRDVGPARPARRARASRGGCRRRRRRRCSISLSARVLDRVGDGRLDDLHADDLARPAGQRQADRADAAVEVVDALVAAQRRALGRDARRAARPSRCWSGRTPRARSGTRSSPSSLAQLRRAGRAAASRRPAVLSPRPGGLRPEQALAAGRRRSARRRRSLPGEVTRRTWNSPVRRPSRTTRLRRKPLLRRAGPRRSGPGARHPASTCLAQLVAALGGEHAVGRSAGSRRSGPGAWKPHTSSPSVAGRRTSTRACCGSATARRRGRSAPARSPRGGRCGVSASSTCAALTSSWRS